MTLMATHPDAIEKIGKIQLPSFKFEVSSFKEPNIRATKLRPSRGMPNASFLGGWMLR
jgi:hypothetical protein